MSNIIIGSLILIAGAIYFYLKKQVIRPSAQFFIDSINERYNECRFSDSSFYTPEGQHIWIYMGSCRPYNGVDIWNFKEKRSIRKAIKNAHRKKLNDPKGEMRKIKTLSKY